MEQIEIRSVWWRQLLLTLLSLALTALGVAVVILVDYIPYQVGGVIGAVFFFGCFLSYGFGLVHPKPVFVMNHQGFKDQSNLAEAGFISWNQVKEVYVYTYENQKYIGVELLDQDSWVAKLSGKKKGCVWANLKLGLPPINISLNTAKETPEQVCELMLKMALESGYEFERTEHFQEKCR